MLTSKIDDANQNCVQKNYIKNDRAPNNNFLKDILYSCISLNSYEKKFFQKALFLWGMILLQGLVTSCVHSKKNSKTRSKVYSAQSKHLGKAYSPPARKGLPPMVRFTPEQWLYHLSSALDTIQTLSADLLQRNPNGTMMHAKFYLQRPGKMRLVYDPPSKMQIIATQGRLIHYDGQRDHSQSMALSNSPVAFLLTGTLYNQVQLTEMIDNHQTITLGMKLKKDPNAGKIQLTFHKTILLNQPKLCPLLGWSMTDPYGKTTTITLFHGIKNGLIPSGAFELQKK